jgi:RNA polymerase sigma-70 factor (ECF subfamily)
MIDSDEARLIRWAKEGDTRAFDALVGIYGRVVYNLALRMVGDPDDASDLTQRSFLRAWNGLGSFDSNRRFFSWLYRITINESLRLLEERRPLETLDERMADPAPSPEEYRNRRERSDRVQAALMAVGANDREILVLRYFGQLSYAELGELLEVPEKTIKSRLYTARQTLGRVLRQRGFPEDDAG